MIKQALLILGASALALSASAGAKSGKGHGHGHRHGQVHGKNHGKGHGHSYRHGQVHGKNHWKGHGHSRHAAFRHDNHGKGTLHAYGWGGCPPGLAWKNNGCIPPGHLRKLYSKGQLLPMNYGSRWSYDEIPMDLRSNYGFRPDARYYYGDGYIYQVDPRTMLIQQVVSAIIR